MPFGLQFDIGSIKKSLSGWRARLSNEHDTGSASKKKIVKEGQNSKV